MKRDMDLVRKILLAVEIEKSGHAPDKLMIEEYTEEQIGYHVLIMIEANLLEGEEVSELGSPSPMGMASRMTWEGHDFLDACREEKRWQTAKGIANQIGGVTLDVFKKVLAELMVSQAKGLIS